MAKTNSTCVQTRQHDWTVTAADGWFSCHRSGCSAYATCPACLGVRVADTHIHFCSEHIGLVQFVNDYPIAEPIPVDVAPLVEQQALW